MTKNIFKSKFIIILLITVLLVPITAPSLQAASQDDNQKDSWVRGVLLVFLSFLINHFLGEEEGNSTEMSGSKIGTPLVDDNSKVGKSEILGFYVNWLSNYADSHKALRTNHNNIDMTAPFWYTLKPNGEIESRYGGHQYEATSLAKNRNIKVLPLINNNQSNNNILIDSEIRKKAVNNIVQLINKYDYDGVNIDFEFIPSWTRQGYTKFIKQLAEKMPEEKLLTISVFPKIDVPLSLQGAYDYGALAPYVDRLVIMTYDHHWGSGPPGPIAPINWVEDNIKYALEYIKPEKILLGIANYGYDWPAVGKGQDLSTKEALALAAQKEVDIKWHNKYQVPYFYYWDENGSKHEVWFENSSSTSFKLNLVKQYNLRGIALWRLGNGTEKLWETIENKLR